MRPLPNPSSTSEDPRSIKCKVQKCTYYELDEIQTPYLCISNKFRKNQKSYWIWRSSTNRTPGGATTAAAEARSTGLVSNRPPRGCERSSTTLQLDQALHLLHLLHHGPRCCPPCCRALSLCRRTVQVHVSRWRRRNRNKRGTQL